MENLFKEAFIYKESNCTLISDKQDGIEIAKTAIKHHHELLEQYIAHHPRFGWSLKPVAVPQEPTICTLMAQAAKKAKVGPMAAVAGVLADLAVKEMTTAGAEVAVVENGGEISAMSNTAVDVALAAGDEALSKKLGFRLTEFPLGVATSSGRFSHALSFGDAEAATVFCKSAGLADAAATAVGNAVKGENVNYAIEKGVDVAKSIVGVEGLFILYKGCVGMWGKVPQVIRISSH
ncbi:MAG TPA: UPF0280 family protein [Candidatus Acidoferrales bacterium]|nr:UPF0280 family protein [Candidatus Acidoferrales bacterium]